MDLDTWLTLPGGIFEGRTITNSDLIKAIADKVGAHVDLRGRMTISHMSSVTTVDQIPELNRYVADLAASALELGLTMLDEIGSGSRPR